MLSRFARYSKRKWFLPLVVFLSALDAYVFFVPNEALLILPVMAHPKRWKTHALWVSLGSAGGATSFAYFVHRYGRSWAQGLFPSTFHSKHWAQFSALLEKHGGWGLTLVSVSPFPQHVAVTIAALTEMSIGTLFLAIFIGRATKYLFVAGCAVHSPKILEKLHLAKPFGLDGRSAASKASR
jgi:membrane protein YqaA with SNARE-associated domain